MHETRELLTRLAARFPLRRRSDDWLCLGWPAGDDEQTVQVECLYLDGELRVLITADVCQTRLIAPEDALALGAWLVVGGVSVRDGILSVRHHLRAVDAFADEPDATIIMLRDEAVWLRRVLRQRIRERQAQIFACD
jgi:hypothetical protein